MADGQLQITVLGSGTSSGVPTLGCDCRVCHSADPRDRRLRPSILIQWEGRNILIDTTPDFRQQALRENIERIDAILYTHAHADHILGLDDLRPFNYKQQASIPIYGSEETLGNIQNVFRYVFENHNPKAAVPKVDVHVLNGGCVDLFGLPVQPVRLKHGKGVTNGYRFGPAAYLTDHSEIPQDTLDRLHGLDLLFLDALRHRPHPTHSTVAQSLETVAVLKPKRAFFTHISHDLPHAETEASLPENVRLSYDGLRLEVAAPK
ncbi:MAG TPA: MBL fold metallo-hydrolase [Bryobacteraceae bacterium]|nr:MBL fold metallo-hydrolase [Bryobacteraceae bacterium]